MIADPLSRRGNQPRPLASPAHGLAAGACWFRGPPADPPVVVMRCVWGPPVCQPAVVQQSWQWLPGGLAVEVRLVWPARRLRLGRTLAPLELCLRLMRSLACLVLHLRLVRWVSRWWARQLLNGPPPGSRNGWRPLLGTSQSTWGVEMVAEAGCVLAGLNLGAGMGAGPVWTAVAVQSRVAGGSGGSVGQELTRAARLTISCTWCSDRSYSSSHQEWGMLQLHGRQLVMTLRSTDRIPHSYQLHTI